ncbi:hypothetical protein Tco_0752135 [Tanacetum coccineum]|uniref:Uncharacterized protein n=1 Tax=Tanacetum coccineum TaxID=301880 RepID=A0ABQ4Z624_9ASTR
MDVDNIMKINPHSSPALAEGFADVDAEPKTVPASADSIIADEALEQLDCNTDDEKFENEVKSLEILIVIDLILMKDDARKCI